MLLIPREKPVTTEQKIGKLQDEKKYLEAEMKKPYVQEHLNQMVQERNSIDIEIGKLTAKMQKEKNMAYPTKVLYINPADKKKLKVDVGDTVYGLQGSKIRIDFDGKKVTLLYRLI